MSATDFVNLVSRQSGSHAASYPKTVLLKENLLASTSVLEKAELQVGLSLKEPHKCAFQPCSSLEYTTLGQSVA